MSPDASAVSSPTPDEQAAEGQLAELRRLYERDAGGQWDPSARSHRITVHEAKWQLRAGRAEDALVVVREQLTQAQGWIAAVESAGTDVEGDDDLLMRCSEALMDRWDDGEGWLKLLEDPRVVVQAVLRAIPPSPPTYTTEAPS